MWNLRRPFLFPHNQYNNLWNQIISTHQMDRRCYEKRNTKVFIRTAEKCGSVGSSVSPECPNNVKCGSRSTAGDSQGVGV